MCSCLPSPQNIAVAALVIGSLLIIVIFGSGFGSAAIRDVAGVKSRSSCKSSKENINIKLRELRVEGDNNLVVGNEAASDLLVSLIAGIFCLSLMPVVRMSYALNRVLVTVDSIGQPQ